MCNIQRIIDYCKQQAIETISWFLCDKKDHSKNINYYIEVQLMLENLQNAIRRGFGIEYAYNIRIKF